MAVKRTKRPRIWIWAIAVVIVVIAVVGLWQRSIILNYGERGGSKPHLSVKKITIHDIGEDRIYMTARVMVSNPLLIELNADRLQYELSVDSIKIMETEFVKPVRIKPLDSIMLDLPLEIDRSKLTNLLDRFERQKADSADYTLRARLYFELPVAGNKIYTVNRTERGPAFRMLKLDTEDVDIEKFGFKNSDVSMKLIVENPNTFEISMRNVDYDLRIGKDLHMEGQKTTIIDIPPKSTISLPLELDVHTKSLPRLAWQVLFEKKSTPFQIDFRCKLAGNNDAFKETRLQVKRTGTLDELKR